MHASVETSTQALFTEGEHEPEQGKGSALCVCVCVCERAEMIGQTLFPLCLFRAQSKELISSQASNSMGRAVHAKRDVSREDRIPAHSSALSKRPVWKTIAGLCEANQCQPCLLHSTARPNKILTSSYGTCMHHTCAPTFHSTLCCADKYHRHMWRVLIVRKHCCEGNK